MEAIWRDKAGRLRTIRHSDVGERMLEFWFDSLTREGHSPYQAMRHIQENLPEGERYAHDEVLWEWLVGAGLPIDGVPSLIESPDAMTVEFDDDPFAAILDGLDIPHLVGDVPNLTGQRPLNDEDYGCLD